MREGVCADCNVTFVTGGMRGPIPRRCPSCARIRENVLRHLDPVASGPCPGCGVTVPRKALRGPVPYCGACARERRRETRARWWAKNPGLAKQYAQDRKLKLKMENADGAR